jgi:hypothetical protein
MISSVDSTMARRPDCIAGITARWPGATLAMPLHHRE